MKKMTRDTRRNPVAKAVRTPVFRQRIVTDKRQKARLKALARDARID